MHIADAHLGSAVLRADLRPPLVAERAAGSCHRRATRESFLISADLLRMTMVGKMATLHSTNDVPLPVLENFAADLEPDLLVEVDSSQISFKSAEPQSWIALFATADWWIKLITAYGALYTAEIVKEAAKDSWKNRARGVDALRSWAGGVMRLAGSFKKLRPRLSGKTTIKLGLPVPDEYFGTTLDLIGSDVEHIEQFIVMFIAHLPQINEILDAQRATDRRVLAGVRLTLLEDGALEVSWDEYSQIDGFSHRREVLNL